MPLPEAAGESASLSVVLADDHAIVRAGIRLLLEDAGMEVVAEAGDVDAAVRYVSGHHPDVLILDINMPGPPSISAIPQIHELSPQTRVVVLTMQHETAFAREALRAGASGYLLKEAADADLVAAIHTAHDGGTYLQPSLGARLASEPPSGAEELDGLTDREVGILRLLALGYTNSEIADQLYLSVRTVETHRTHIQSKTGRRSRAELVRYALDHDLVR
jgi:two-component system response regulator NreC